MTDLMTFGLYRLMFVLKSEQNMFFQIITLKMYDLGSLKDTLFNRSFTFFMVQMVLLIGLCCIRNYKY